MNLDKGIMTGKCLELPRCQRLPPCSTGLPTLFGAVLNSRPEIFEISAAILTSKPFLVFKPCRTRRTINRLQQGRRTHGPYCSPTLRKKAQTRNDCLDAFDSVINLLDVTTEFLTKSQGSGILWGREVETWLDSMTNEAYLQVCSPNFDNVLERICLGLESISQFGECRE